MTGGSIAATDFPAGRWRAHWIWFEPPRIVTRPGFSIGGAPADDERFACFRRSFDLDEIPARAPARATADSRYVLWLNGVEVSRGPVRSNGRRLHYDAFDLSPHLRVGRNAIAVLARHYGSATPWWAPTPGSMQLGAGSLVFEAQIGRAWIVSDAQWTVLPGAPWRPAARVGHAMPSEILDARALPADWREPGFDAGGWLPARIVQATHLGFAGCHEPPSHPYGALLPRPIPQLGGQIRKPRSVRLARAARGASRDDPFDQVISDFGAATRAAPTAAAADAPLRADCRPDEVVLATFDFGEVVSGGVRFAIDAPPGAQLDWIGSEFAGAGGAPASGGDRVGLRYVARGAADAFESFDSIGLRHLALAIRADAPVTLQRVDVKERLFPRPAGPYFRCSDPRLDRIWAVGRRSVDLNSHDAYIDCPTREQRAWTGDAVVHQMVDFATNPDWRLARWNVELCASPRPDGMLPMAAGGDAESVDLAFIPDWALHWIRSLHNLHLYVGDRALVGSLLPVAERVLRWFADFLGEDGLLADVTGWVLIDWSAVSVAGRSSVLNGLFARALVDFAEMSEWIGDAGRASWARRIHAGVRSGFERFWDAARERYVDHITGGSPRTPASQHAQAAAIVGHLAPAARHARLAALLMDREHHVHAAWSREAGDARTSAPGARGAAALTEGPPEPWWDVGRQLVVAQPFFRYVVHDALALAGRADAIAGQCLDWMALLERCATSWSETWYGGTVSHGWSATPTRDLMTRTLGVLPAEPGFARARIAPRLGALDWASGALPTPAGLLTIDVNAARIEIDSPLPFDLEVENRACARHPAGLHVFATV